MKKHVPWQSISEKSVLKDQWIDLRAEDCLLANGTTISPYYMLHYPDWVQIICTDESGNVCLTSQYRHGARKTVVELPCGGVEAGESALDAAMRELKEETGIIAKDWRSLGAHSPNPANYSNQVHIFGCKLAELTSSEQDQTEDISHFFAAPSDLTRFVASGKFDQLLHIGSLFKAVQSGFLASSDFFSA